MASAKRLTLANFSASAKCSVLAKCLASAKYRHCEKYSFGHSLPCTRHCCVSTPSAFQIENRKIQLNVQSKVGSLDNVKHRPGGGDKKVFNDIDYLKQVNEMPGAQLMVKSTSGAPSNASSRRESAVQVWKISKIFCCCAYAMSAPVPCSQITASCELWITRRLIFCNCKRSKFCVTLLFDQMARALL